MSFEITGGPHLVRLSAPKSSKNRTIGALILSLYYSLSADFPHKTTLIEEFHKNRTK